MTIIQGSANLPPAEAQKPLAFMQHYDFNLWCQSEGTLALSAYPLIVAEDGESVIATKSDLWFTININTYDPDNEALIAHLLKAGGWQEPSWNAEDLIDLDEWLSASMLKEHEPVPPTLLEFIASLPPYIPEVDHEFIVKDENVWECRYCKILYTPAVWR
jgi:hypothetical protein